MWRRSKDNYTISYGKVWGSMLYKGNIMYKYPMANIFHLQGSYGLGWYHLNQEKEWEERLGQSLRETILSNCVKEAEKEWQDVEEGTRRAWCHICQREMVFQRESKGQQSQMMPRGQERQELKMLNGYHWCLYRRWFGGVMNLEIVKESIGIINPLGKVRGERCDSNYRRTESQGIYFLFMGDT